MKLRIIFANIMQCVLHCGFNEKKENISGGFHPEKYIEYFTKEEPDILCLAECIMDNDKGISSFIDKLSKKCDLPYYKNLSAEKAWLVKDKFYGLSICSKFPFLSYKVLKLANPKIETIRPNGDHWVMHDKYIQKASLEIPDGKQVNIINTHMFPFQHFDKHFWDKEFAEYRKQWAKMLKPTDKISFITGDFNTVNISIDEAFPELGIDDTLQSLISFDGRKHQPKYPYDTQIEYILATKDFKLLSAKEDMCYSDHPFLIVEVEI